MPTAAHSSHSAMVVGVDAVDGRDDEQGGVGGAQAGAQLADEVGVAGGVEQVDLDRRVLERGDSDSDTERCWRTSAGS